MPKKKKSKTIQPVAHRFAKYISGDSLNLSRMFLSDADMPEIIQLLHQNPDITRLDLSLNNIGDQGIAAFSERNQTVTEVNFTGNNIGDRGIVVFAYNNLTVRWVNFSHNPISNKGIESYVKINDICSSSHFSTMQYH